MGKTDAEDVPGISLNDKHQKLSTRGREQHDLQPKLWKISNNLIILPQRLLALFQAMFVHRPLAADSLPPPKE